MSTRVTAQEARIINRYFRAVRTAKGLDGLNAERRLTWVERRQLHNAEDERDALLPLVADINARTLNNNKLAA